jgi:ankyrin repeat protein
VIAYILSEYIAPWDVKMSNKVTLFHYFAKKGLKDELNLCLNCAVDIDIPDSESEKALGYTALIFACKYGHTDIALYLLQEGADINYTDKLGNSAVHYAALENNVRLLKILMEGDP